MGIIKDQKGFAGYNGMNYRDFNGHLSLRIWKRWARELRRSMHSKSGGQMNRIEKLKAAGYALLVLALFVGGGLLLMVLGCSDSGPVNSTTTVEEDYQSQYRWWSWRGTLPCTLAVVEEPPDSCKHKHQRGRGHGKGHSGD